MLYLIPFLHQTTTAYTSFERLSSCILFHFYIKPQRLEQAHFAKYCCILFHFYIKPQRTSLPNRYRVSCILFHFYIKPQRMAAWLVYSLRCILFHFYIKPQLDNGKEALAIVVSYSISTSNHNLWRIRYYFQAHYHLNHILIFNGML